MVMRRLLSGYWRRGLSLRHVTVTVRNLYIGRHEEGTLIRKYQRTDTANPKA